MPVAATGSWRWRRLVRASIERRALAITQRPVSVTRVQVAAAQGRIVTDKRLGLITPAWVHAVAEARPATRVAPDDPR